VRYLSIAVSFLLSGGIVVGAFYLLAYIMRHQYNYLPYVLAALDTILPTILYYINEIEVHLNEGDSQESYLFKLFFVRVLVPVILPYVNTRWNEFLDASTLSSILSVQIAIYFTAPIITLLGVDGYIHRHILGPLLSDNQYILNSYWDGSEWSLAERYSNISKILFVSVFYSFITPISLFIGAFAYIVIFCIDRYLLLRKWKPVRLLTVFF
jgi:hypothetical protein